MFKDEFKESRLRWGAARKRADAAEKQISETFLDSFFRREAKASERPSRPCINVTPPKQPPKK
jgi:hypothetical protein